MNIKTLVDAVPSIQKIARQDLSAKTLYCVSRLMSRLENELKSYDSVREKLIEKYCETIDGKIVPKKESLPEFEKEMAELLETEVDTNGLKIVEIPADEDIRLSYADLCLLEEFIKIKFEEE